MASGISKALKEAAESYAKEVQKEEDKKVQKALKNTAVQVEKKLDEILKEDMVEAYYAGYNPVSYKRTGQLNKAVKSYTDLQESGSVSGFGFGAVFDESKMKHKKRGKKVKTKPSELKILEKFQEGVHPNAVERGYTGTPNAMPLFDDDRNGSVPEIIEDWVENDGIVDIFLSELAKLQE